MTPMYKPPAHRDWQRLSAVLVLGVVLGNSGCVVGPDCCLPVTPVPDQWHQTLVQGEYTDANELAEWWTLFNDPVLNHIVNYAAYHNLDLQSAVARIWQADSQVCIAASARLVQINGRKSIQVNQQSKNAIGAGTGVPGFLLGPRTFWTTGTDVSWEPDLFGRVYRSIEAAEANLCANVEAYRDILVTLYGEVAATYVQVRTLQEQLDYGRSNVEIQKQALDLAKKRVEGGVSPIVDQYQAESNLATTESELPPLEILLQQSLNRLSVLVGEYPGSLHQALCTPAPIPDAPPRLPLVIPCNVVRQRPDIRQAERI
ncbi:MAG TPA: TolC family protein, partial [Pirellulaceae bacterium]